MSCWKMLLCIAAVVCISLGCYAAQEHPEHPEHPTTAEETVKPLSTDELADAITTEVHRDTKLKGGHFLIYDKDQDEVLALQLDKVHRERVAHIGNDVYFVCADFKERRGTMYDLDFWMKRDDKGLHVNEITVHKVDGKARYNWSEERGVWKRNPVK